MIPSPAMALLIASARRQMNARAIETAHAAIQRGVDWDLLLSLAYQHGLTPLFYRHVTDGAIPTTAIPAHAVVALQRQAAATTQRSLYLTGELLTLLRDFSAHDISAVPLKGPVLAESLYGSVALRRFNDLDLLLHERDLPRAMARLYANGYRVSEELHDWERRTVHHVSMFAPSGFHRVELHYHLLHPVGRARYGVADVADQLHSIVFHGVPVQVLSDEALLVYLSLHGSGHVWERLEWLCGIAELLGDGETKSGRIRDWDRVYAYARRFDAVRRVHAALLIAHDLLGAHIPDAVRNADRRTQGAARSVANRLVTNPGERCGSIRTYTYQLRTDANLRTSLSRSWMTLFAPYRTDHAALPLPRPLWPLYIFLRPLRLTYRHGGEVLRRAVNKTRRSAGTNPDLVTSDAPDHRTANHDPVNGPKPSSAGRKNN